MRGALVSQNNQP